MNRDTHTADIRALRAIGARGNPEQDGSQNRRIPVNAVCDLCGGVSHMTIWRWSQDDALGFPKPIYISRRRYWRESDVVAWLESRAEVA